MSDARDGAAVQIPPPLVFLAAVIAGVPLHAFAVPFPLGVSPVVRILLATIGAVAALALIGTAARLFRRTGQDPKPWASTPEIVATGVYKLTRNPMYVGMGLLQASLGVGLANGWIVVLVLPAIAVVHITAVRHEEAYLERKFGAAYREYKASVRRWI